MAFHTGQYDTYIILGSPEAEMLWRWPVWQTAATAVTPVIDAARHKAAVRSIQYLPERKGNVKLGRIGWNEKGHHKWSHGSPRNQGESDHWTFLHAEVWAPSWATCERQDTAPDVFLSIGNEALGEGYNKKLRYNPVVVFAVAKALADNHGPQVHFAISRLADLTHSLLTGFKQRSWGRSSGLVGFTDAIQDLWPTGLFKAGPKHIGPVGFDLLADEWEEFSGKVP